MLAPKSLKMLLEERLTGGGSVLDVGCERCSFLKQVRTPLYKIGVDFYEPYLEKARKESIHSGYVRGDVKRLPFQGKSFDYCVSVEVLEHLHKSDGLVMLSEMERVARRAVMLTTPNGFLPVTPGPEDKPEEKHVSGWRVKELRDLGYEVYGFGAWKDFPGKKFVRRVLFGLLGTAELFLNQHPELAFQAFCYKNIPCSRGGDL
jgi:SAM-dependent methyltransferase